MSGIEELLDAGEEIQQSVNPSRFDTKYIKSYLIAGGLILAIVALLIAKSVFELEFLPSNLIAFGLIAPLALIVHGEVKRKFVAYHFTDREIIEENGMLDKNYINIPYSRIQDVSLDTDLEERIFDVGDLHIRTAGTHQSEQILNGLRDPESYKVVITRRSSGDQNSESQEENEFGQQAENNSGSAVEQDVLRQELQRVKNELAQLDQKSNMQGLTASEKQEWYEMDGQKKLLQRLVEDDSGNQNF